MATGPDELVFLGTGTSHGVPMIGCDCAVCRSADPRDRRNRCSAVVRGRSGGTVLIDASPELRLSAVAVGLCRVDAVLLTHAHADHVMGLDDLRRFNDAIGGSIPCYADAATLGRVARVFDYAVVPFPRKGGDRPSIALVELQDYVPAQVGGHSVLPVPLLHGQAKVLGFRFCGVAGTGDWAYCTDCSAIPDRSAEALAGLDLLVLDALRRTPHPTHFNLEGALAAIERLRPRRALLTHITHELSHEATNAQLPENVRLAYDGQIVSL